MANERETTVDAELTQMDNLGMHFRTVDEVHVSSVIMCLGLLIVSFQICIKNTSTIFLMSLIVTYYKVHVILCFITGDPFFTNRNLFIAIIMSTLQLYCIIRY